MPLAKMNKISQCVLSTRNITFSNFVQIKSVKLVLCEYAKIANHPWVMVVPK